MNAEKSLKKTTKVSHLFALSLDQNSSLKREKVRLDVLVFILTSVN